MLIFSSFECYSIPEDPNIERKFEEIAAEFLKEVKKRAEEDNDLNGKLLTEELPVSLTFYDADVPSPGLAEVQNNRNDKADIIAKQEEGLTCETLDKPCVYFLIGLSY